MAEGGDLPSLTDGSDADFDFTCTPCGEDSIRWEAVKYCPECQEYLCTSCTRHHGRQKATRAHKLLDKDDAKKGSLVAKTKCRHHPERDIEMYCGTHDMVYCVLCIATEHRACDGVNRIDDEPTFRVNQTEMHRVLDETNTVKEYVKALAVKQEENLTSLEEQRNDIQDNLDAIETRLIEHIRKSKRETLEALDKSYTKEKVEIESEISVSTNMIHSLEKTSEQLQTKATVDAGQGFVQMKLLKETVTDANKLRAKSESYCTKSIYFKDKTTLIASVMSEAVLGQVHVEDESRPSNPVVYNMKTKLKINVKIASDKSTCIISDVCQLPDGMILLTDHGNNKVKRLDLNYEMKDHCDLDAVPTGVCCVSKNEVAVKMSNQNIQFISFASTLSKTRCITIVGGDVYGMAYFSGELWVSTGVGVNVYSVPTGMLVKCIAKDQNGRSLFKSTTQHLAVNGDNVFVADHSDGAVSLDKDGIVRRELRDKRLVNTHGVCVSGDGTVFLCGYNSNNIVMFSRDGKCLGVLIAADNGIENPISLCYDVDKHSIIVACATSNNIHVVELGV